MKTIAIDTATDDTVVAAGDGDSLLFSFTEGPDESGRPRHSRSLMGAVDAAAEAIGGWSCLDSVAVGLGPGTFTGIRIAIATAHGLSLASGKPSFGFSTLDALAAGMSGPGVEPEPRRLAVIDARRGEVFAALYGPDLARTWKPFVNSPDQLASRLAGLGEPVLAAGSGAIRFREELKLPGVHLPGPEAGIHRLSPEAVLASGSKATSDPLEPVYLRPPDAQLWTQPDPN